MRSCSDGSKATYMHSHDTFGNMFVNHSFNRTLESLAKGPVVILEVMRRATFRTEGKWRTRVRAVPSGAFITGKCIILRRDNDGRSIARRDIRLGRSIKVGWVDRSKFETFFESLRIRPRQAHASLFVDRSKGRSRGVDRSITYLTTVVGQSIVCFRSRSPQTLILFREGSFYVECE